MGDEEDKELYDNKLEFCEFEETNLDDFQEQLPQALYKEFEKICTIFKTAQTINLDAQNAMVELLDKQGYYEVIFYRLLTQVKLMSLKELVKIPAVGDIIVDFKLNRLIIQLKKLTGRKRQRQDEEDTFQLENKADEVQYPPNFTKIVSSTAISGIKLSIGLVLGGMYKSSPKLRWAIANDRYSTECYHITVENFQSPINIGYILYLLNTQAFMLSANAEYKNQRLVFVFRTQQLIEFEQVLLDGETDYEDEGETEEEETEDEYDDDDDDDNASVVKGSSSSHTTVRRRKVRFKSDRKRKGHKRRKFEE